MNHNTLQCARRCSKLFTDTMSLSPTQRGKRSLGHRDVKGPSYSHTGGKWQSQALNPRILELMLLTKSGTGQFWQMTWGGIWGQGIPPWLAVRAVRQSCLVSVFLFHVLFNSATFNQPHPRYQACDISEHLRTCPFTLGEGKWINGPHQTKRKSTGEKYCMFDMAWRRK